MIQFLRFPVKLTFAVLLALLLGFVCNLETPRWAVMTAAIVAGGQAFAAGGDPYSGALRHRGILRVIGTIIGCVVALTLMILFVRAPFLMLFMCCVWTGVSVWISSLVRVENSYAFGLAGYTTLIIIVTASASNSLQLLPRFAVERCCEIFLGILCAILSDIIFSPRSIKRVIDQEIEQLLVSQYQLLQRCIRGAPREQVDQAWGGLVRRSSMLPGMSSQLKLESSRWANSTRRLKQLHTVSLTLITQATETFLILTTRPDYIPSTFYQVLEHEVLDLASLRKVVRKFRRYNQDYPDEPLPHTLNAWMAAAAEYLLLAKGIHSNARITRAEEEIFGREVTIDSRSAETHHAMINGVRTFLATFSGVLFWLYTGWTAGSGCMIILGVVTSLAMRTPNPLMMAKDFLYGMTAALPIGALIYMWLLPNTQQSVLLLCLVVGSLSFISGIFIQRRLLGTLGAFVGTLNIIVLSNPISFHIESFLDNSLGQVIGCFLALMSILLIRDNSKARTGRKILNRLMLAAVSSLTTNEVRRRENHLPALYQQLFLLLNLFPDDIAKYRLALMLIISQQRLRSAKVPVTEQLSNYHYQLRHTGHKVIASRSVERKHYYYQRLIKELGHYESLLVENQAPSSVSEPVRRFINILTRYQSTLINI